MARVGTIRPTLVQLFGMGIPTPTASVQVLPGPISLAGASDSASLTRTTILIIIPGGALWVTTVVAGIRTTDGERGAERPRPTFTVVGAIPLTPGQRRLGRIPGPGISVQRVAVEPTTRRRDGSLRVVADTTQISIQEILPDIEAQLATIRIRGSWRERVLGLLETVTQDQEQPAVA